MNFITHLWDKVYQSSFILAWTGGICLVLFAIFVPISHWDTRILMGQNIWVKPLKFTLSLAVYSWTIAIIFNYYPYSKKLKGRLGICIAMIAFVEIAIIGLQVFRGEISHFNISTPFNGILYYIMGVAIFINFILLSKMLIDSFSTKLLGTKALNTGIQLGVLSVLMASIVGGLMSALLSHSIGLNSTEMIAFSRME